MNYQNMETRTVRRFLFLPKELPNFTKFRIETKWLRFMRITQMYDSATDRWVSLYWEE